MNYDPNLTNSGKMATQTVKLTFQQWEHKAEFTIDVGGNCTGLSAITYAVDTLFEKLVEEQGTDHPEIIMLDGKGEEMICCDDEFREEEWLNSMLVKAEIIDIKPQ